LYRSREDETRKAKGRARKQVASRTSRTIKEPKRREGRGLMKNGNKKQGRLVGERLGEYNRLILVRDRLA